MSYILWQPELLDNPAFCALMAECPDYLGLWFRCLQIADAAQRDGDLAVFGGKALTPKTLALAHFRRADSDSLALAGGFLELAVELGLLDQTGDRYAIAWWADFSKGLSETRDAWRARKADQRARARTPVPQAPETPSPPVPEVPEPVSRDSHGTVPQSPEPTNQPINQTTNTTKQASNQSRPGTPAPGSAQVIGPGRLGNLAKALAHGADDPQAVLARLAEHNARNADKPRPP